MKKLNSMLSLIAMMVAVIMLLPNDANAQRHARCNHGILAKTKKCPVLGCGTIGKCAHCRQVERRAKANCARCRVAPTTTAVATPRLTQPPPVMAPVPSMQNSTIAHEPVVVTPVVENTVVTPSLETPIVEAPQGDDSIVGLPSCGLPSMMAPAPSCGAPSSPSLLYGSGESSCDAPGQVSAARACSQFYQANTTCSGCDELGCDGGCATVMDVASSCDSITSNSVSSPTCDCATCTQACGCGSYSCNGSCGGYGDVEMTFAESLWADICCEPYRSNYCSVFGGFGETEDFYPTEFIPARGSFDDGWIAGISKGRFLTKCLRAELEYTFREGNAEELTIGGVTEDWEGELQVHAMMFNAVFQLNYGPMAYISPYYGAGVGVAFFDSDIDGQGGNLSLNETQLAWQGLFGVNVALSQGIDLFGEYRIMRTSELELQDSVSGDVLGTTDPEFNTYLVGLRFYR